MQTYDIYQLVEDLTCIENFLLDVVNNARIIRRRGLSAVADLDSYEETSVALSTLEAKLNNFSRTANIVNPVIGAKFDEIIRDSNISKASAEISVSLKIAAREQKSAENISSVAHNTGAFLAGLVGIAPSLFRTSEAQSPLFLGQSQIDIKGILIDIERINPMIKTVRDEMYARAESDFETFKPSNISIENVNIFIQAALSIVSESDDIPSETRGNIEEYLKDIKVELARDTPAWKQIVGALVIVSAILGGLASAPDALQNVRGAINEILGTSIDEISPKPEDRQDQLPNFTIAKRPVDDETLDA